MRKNKKLEISYIDAFSDIPDHILFIVVFIIGTVSIISLKHFELPQYVITLIPILLMLVYAFYVGITQRYMLQEDKAGDNLYYLGFLYTLVSLSYSLYSLEQQEQNTSIIISSFGIALSTTITGLMLRVIFNQLREDPVEIEQQARIELSNAAQKLKSEMNIVVLEFNDFRRQMIQSLSESINDITEKTKNAFEININKYAEASEKVLTTINDAFSIFIDNTRRLNELSDKTVNTLNQLIQRIENIEAPPDAIKGKLDSLLDGLSKSVGLISTDIIKQDDTVKVLNQALRAFVDSTSTIRDNYSGISSDLGGSLQLLDQEINSIKSNIVIMNNDLIQLSKSLQENTYASSSNIEYLKNQIMVDLNIIQSHKERIQINIEESDRMIEKVQKSLISLTDTIINELSDKNN